MSCRGETWPQQVVVGAGFVGRSAVVRVVALAVACAVATCALLAAPVVSGAAEDEQATLKEYIGRVEDSLDVVEEAGRDTVDARDANDIAAIVNTWIPLTEQVRMSGGQVMETDNSILRSLSTQLPAAEGNGEREAVRAELESHLRSMLKALEVSPGRIPEDREALDRVLGSQVPRMRSPFAELLGKVAERILEWLQGWWGSFGASPETSQALTTVTLAIMAALLVALLALVVRAIARARRAVAAPAQVARPARPSVPARDPDEDLSPKELASRADALAAEGRLREAVRALMAGATRLLAAAGLAARARTRTNGELLREVRGRAVVHDALARIALVFDRAWYGHVDMDGAAWGAARAAYRDLERALVADATGGGGAATPSAASSAPAPPPEPPAEEVSRR